MKTITFSNQFFKEQKINVCENVAFIIGDNGSGKTTILNTLEQGFMGKDNRFTVDGEKIGFDHYQVIFLKEYFDLKENLKITKTSWLRNYLLQNINNCLLSDSGNEIKKIDNSLVKSYEFLINLIDNVYFNNIEKDNNLSLKANIEPFSFPNLIDKMLKISITDNNNEIIDETKYSHYYLRILLFNILKSNFNEDDKIRKKVILFDLPELYGTPKSLFILNKVLKDIIKNLNTTIIFTTNSPDYINLFDPPLKAINLIKNNSIFSINNLKKIILNSILLFSFSDSDINDFSVYKSNLVGLIDDSDLIKEENYVYKFLYKKIVYALFASKIYFFVQNKTKYDYILEYLMSIKDLVLINNILLFGFNINCYWDISSKEESIKKILPYVNN